MAVAPSGISPSVQNSTQSSSGDPLSPTTIILNRLRAQGVPITPENIRRAVTELGRLGGQDPTETSPGGLSVQRLDDSPSVGQRGNVAQQVEGGGSDRSVGRGAGNRGAGRGRGLPVPPIPPTGTASTGPVDRRDGAAQTTSAPPTGGGLDLSDLIAPSIAGGAVGLNYLANRRGGQTYMGNNPMDPTGRMIDVPLPSVSGPTGIGGANSALPQPDIRALPEPTPSLAGPGAANAPPPATDMEAAMQRAIAPPMTPDAAVLGGSVRPYTPDPGAIIGAGQRLPPGVSDLDAARAAIGPGGMTQDRVAGQVGVPDVPFTSDPAIRGAPPVEAPSRAGFLNALIESLSSAARFGARK